MLGKPIATLRLLHFRSGKVSDPSKGIYGAGAHSDYGLITLLATDDVVGLQICKDRDAKPQIWEYVPPVKGAFIVNLGDMLERWSNCVFKSTVHRVLGNGQERYSVFAARPVFKGIKMIPPGVHFIFYSSSNRDGKEFSPIIGFFIVTSSSEVVVRKWNLQEERLVKLPEEEEERYAQAVKCMEFDRQLGPYSLSDYSDWKRVSNYIIKDVIDQIEPIGGEITVESESSLLGIIPKTTMEKALAEQLENSKFNKEVDNSEKKGCKKGCYYTTIPRVIKQKGASVAELTSLNLDKTQILERILVKEYDGVEDRLLGELQFSFIAFLMGQSLEGFLQWKSLVSLLLGCTEAPFHTRSQLFTKRENTRTNGLEKESPLLLDDSWFSTDSFLHHLCKDFFSLVSEASVVDGDLLTWTRKLRELLENTLGWEFQHKSTLDGLDFEEGDEIAYFLEPSHECVVECLPTCKSEMNPPKFTAVRCDEYLSQRYRDTHTNLSKYNKP